MKKFLLVLSMVGLLALTPMSSQAADEPLRGEGRCFKGHIGLQLYSLRDSFGKDINGSMDKVKNMGFLIAV